MKRFAVLLLVLVSCISGAWAITNEYSRRTQGLSKQILFRAEELVDATYAPVFDSLEAEEILIEMKELIKEYETIMVFAESPYPGEIMLGTTPGGDSTWLVTLCSTRYDGPLKEIRLRRTGHRARYLRINDIEITSVTPKGPEKATFNKSGRVRLYSDGVFRLALPKPMRVRRIRININHESTGLEVTGIPYELNIIQPRAYPRVGRVERTRYPAEVLLGTTPGGDGTWLETLCSSPYDRPIREIRLERTGRKASYLRINDIEVTYLAPGGPRKTVFNQNGRFKLRYDDVYRLSLPRPMRITKIRVRVDHESTGLKVYGVH
jgi:hypothetical protein